MAKDPNRRDLFSGALELMILHTLRLKPMHGYALAKHIKQASEDLLQVEEGSLYPALQRLLREGLLECEAGTSAKGRPTRIYRLTDGGLRHLEHEGSSYQKMSAGIMRVLAVASLQEGENVPVRKASLAPQALRRSFGFDSRASCRARRRADGRGRAESGG
jgi:PadR family transcriptional regulator, regulatory protein PadR